MTRHRFVLAFLGSSFLFACGGAQKKPEHQHDDTLVPEETQERSRNQYGQQQMRMDELSMTPAEQAAARHDNATRPVESEKYGKEKKRN
jgi:outer membrane biogenesis lipoprotein LolB